MQAKEQSTSTPSGVPSVKLNQGIHVMHLFYRVNRVRWAELSRADSEGARWKLESLCKSRSAVSHPRIATYVNVCGKADFAFILYAAELGEVAQMHRDIEQCFPPGALERVFSYLSVTELTDYMPTDEDNRRILIEQEKIEPESEAFKTRWAELSKRKADYEHYRLYPEMPDWEVMGFYPMNKRRSGNDNWYSLDFPTRKRLMGGHARVGRKYAGRVSQLITGSTGLDDWEWGVTLMAHQTDALKEIVYEMRFDEVSARYGEFGPFYINLRLQPAAIWAHLHL
ncbi:MAG TPA: hydrogen peroxide-dependent heme synthase [Candidatus Binatia bacterium]|nr:hydrogen peroxide-dependent heme synthase [Candidatus Binatia bacterium]